MTKQVRVDADTHKRLRDGYAETTVPMTVQVRKAVRRSGLLDEVLALIDHPVQYAERSEGAPTVQDYDWDGWLIEARTLLTKARKEAST